MSNFACKDVHKLCYSCGLPTVVQRPKAYIRQTTIDLYLFIQGSTSSTEFPEA